ncbi:MAG: M42 family metallopeptidase [Firmicutes bacterium]|nr:M42 family metallopeptidase [Bacillota bacterium]
MQFGDLVQEMCLIPALAGHETPMIKYLHSAFTPHADQVTVDKAGNVIAKIAGTDPAAPSVMVFAHMDQLGLVVRKISEDGFIRVERLGGVPEKVLPGLRVQVLSEDGDPVPGVIGLKAHHATGAEEKYKVIPYQDLYIDVGAASSCEVRNLGIEVGCPVVYEPSFQVLTGGRISGTSLDDRGGCAILVKLAEQARVQRPAATLYLVGTVQEEFNLRGAQVAANVIKPDLAISLDLVVAGDTPDLKDRSDLRLGGGPAMSMYSFHGRGTLNGTIPHPRLVQLAKEAASRAGVPLQRSAMVGILTDSAYVQLVGDGIPVIDLGFPARYTHTPIEVCQLSDLEGLFRLVWEMVWALAPGMDLSRL